MNAGPLRVAYISPVRQNPYVRLLAAGVRQADASIHTSEHPNLRRRLLLPGLRPHVLHLHWAELQYGYGNPDREQAFYAWRRFLIRLRWYRALGGRLVYTVHNLGQHEGRFPDLDSAANRWLFSHAAAIHVHDEGVAGAVTAQFGRRRGLFTIPHGHYRGVYPDEISRAQARARFGLTPDRFVYLCLGQIRPYKGIEQLVAAFNGLEDDSVLLIAGHVGVPDYGREIEKLTAGDPRIQLYPQYVAEETLQYFFHAADACVFPYRRATTSGAALLAFSFGKPILAPDLGPFPALAGEARGVLYDESATGLAGGLRRIRQLPAARAQAAIDQFLNGRDWARLGEQHAAMYRRVLKSETL